MALENDADDADPYELISQSRQFAYGSTQRSDLLDRAITAADRSGSARAQFDARRERMTCAVFGGEGELALALFVWCQHMADDRPDIIDPSELLWDYKHVLAQLPMFARISQQQIDKIEADMARRYQANGASQRPVYLKRAEVALFQGKIALARALWDEGMRHPRDSYADCAACELSTSLQLCVAEQRFDEMLAAAKPILEGRMRCTEVPHLPLPRIMLAMYAIGRKDEARKLREHSYQLIRSNPNFIEQAALHVEYLVAEQDLERAAQLALRHVPWLQTVSDRMQLHYVRALHCVLRAAGGAANGDAQWLQLLLDGLEGVYGSSPEATGPATRLKLLAGRVADAGLALASGLDQRNGNDYLARQWQADAFAIA